MVVASLTAACGSGGSGAPPTSTAPATIDTREVESALVANQKRTTPDLDVRDPSCPPRVEARDGSTFTCTVVVEGVAVPYQVTLADTATKLRYDIRPARAIILVPKLADAVRAQVPGATVDCGTDRIKVLDVGATVDCRVAGPAGATARTVTFRVDDVDGNLRPVGQ